MVCLSVCTLTGMGVNLDPNNYLFIGISVCILYIHGHLCICLARTFNFISQHFTVIMRYCLVSSIHFPTHLLLGPQHPCYDVLNLTHTPVKEVSIGQLVLGDLTTFCHNMPGNINGKNENSVTSKETPTYSTYLFFIYLTCSLLKGKLVGSLALLPSTVNNMIFFGREALHITLFPDPGLHAPQVF